MTADQGATTTVERVGIFGDIMKDHEEVKGLFEKLENGAENKSATFETLRSELVQHTKAEEKVLYAPFLSREDLHEDLLEAYEEHHVVSLVLQELNRGRSRGERWDAKLTVLRELIEHHVEEEEGSLLPKISSLVDPEKARSMGREFQEQKRAIAREAEGTGR